MTEENKEKKIPTHYNKGVVWGRVASVEEDISTKKTPYVSIVIETPNDIYGNIKTFGRLWKDKGTAFLAHFKANPGAAYKFSGFFGQYEKDEKIFSNYTFTQWQAYTGTDFRTAFILVGEVIATSKVDDDGRILLDVSRPGGLTPDGERYKDTEEDFEVFTLNAQAVDGLHEGDIIKAKGMLRYKEAEDEFGDTPEHGKVKPYVMDLLPLWESKKEAF